MNLDDIKKLITFSRRGPGTYGIQVRHAATLQITAEVGVDANPDRQPPKAEIEARLTHEILRRLYDNRQREFADLLMEHAMAHPFSGEIHENRQKLLDMARQMKPKDE